MEKKNYIHILLSFRLATSGLQLWARLATAVVTVIEQPEVKSAEPEEAVAFLEPEEQGKENWGRKSGEGSKEETNIYLGIHVFHFACLVGTAITMNMHMRGSKLWRL